MAKPMNGSFISYRRQDSQSTSGRLADSHPQQRLWRLQRQHPFSGKLSVWPR